MRVTHVITRLIVGGAQENTIASVLGLRQKAGLEVDLVAGPTYGPEGSLEPALAGLGSAFTVVPEIVRPLHPWKDALAWQKLTRLFRARQPHIVHTHSGKAGVLGRLAAARAGVPIIVHTIHGPSFGGFQGGMANLVFRSAERHAGSVTTHFVVVADAMKQQYLAAGIGRPEQYTRIVSGFDLKPFVDSDNDFELRGRLGLSPDDMVIGMISRLFKLKGHSDLLAIAPALLKNCPKAKFLLVGEGPWRGLIERQAHTLGVDRNVVFAGLVAPTAVPSLLGIMDLLVHLSLREGLPRALPQALAAARPVVAYDVDGAKEVCVDNETGFLVRPGDLQTLSERLLRLAHEPGLRQRFGRRGQQLVQQYFSVERMVDDLYQLYVRLMKGLPA